MQSPRFLMPSFRLMPAEWLIVWGLFVATGMILMGYPILLFSFEGGEVMKMLTVMGKYGQIIFVCILLYGSTKLLLGKLNHNINYGAGVDWFS